MDERLRTTNKDDIHQFIVATSNSYYMENKWILKNLFEKSLRAKRGDYSIADIQFQILAHIIAADSARRKYVRWKGLLAKAIGNLRASGAPLERIATAQERFQFMQDSETSVKLFLGQLRSIGDGIAWWFFNYDRVSMRLLVEHDYVPPPIRGTGLNTEIYECAKLAVKSQPFLLNTVTNFVRFADITVYDKPTDTFKLVEVKSGKLQTRRTIRQGKQLALAQEGLQTDTHSVFPDTTIIKIMAKAPLLTYVKILERAMAEAEEELASSRVFGNYLSFAVFNMTKLHGLPEKDANQIRNRVLSRCMSISKSLNDIILPVQSNLTFVVHFSRMLAPYTIFPLTYNRRLGLINGDFLMFSKLNISGLERWLRSRGWKTWLVPWPDAPNASDELRYVPILRVSRKNSYMSIEIPLDILFMASVELWMPESIERVISALLDKGVPGNAYSVNFPNVGKYAWD